MSRVRITVEDPILGDVEVEQDNRVASFSPDNQRQAISALLRKANEQIARAYELEAQK